MRPQTQTYEGYFENGHFYPIGNMGIQGRCRVLVTVLEGPTREKNNTWAELDKLIANMDEKPRLEDFPRCQFVRELVDFEKV